MKLIVTWLCAGVVAGIAACSSMGSTAASAYHMLGGAKGVESLASNFLSSSLKDPSLSGLTKGKTIDTAAATDKVSNQLCSELGGGCKAPFTDSQISSAASKLSADQSKSISNNFSSALSKLTSDPTIQELVTKTVGSKLPGILASVL